MDAELLIKRLIGVSSNAERTLKRALFETIADPKTAFSATELYGER